MIHVAINAKLSFVFPSQAFLVSILDVRYGGRVHCVTHLLSNQKPVWSANEPMASGGGASFSKYSTQQTVFNSEAFRCLIPQNT